MAHPPCIGEAPLAEAVIDRLEKKGYVHRIRHPDDRRKIHVALTPHGRKQVMDIYRPVQ